MDNFINGIKFNKTVSLKKSKKKLKESNKKGSFNFFPKLIRLIYFFSIIAILFFGGRYAIESVVSFCQGTEHQSWNEITGSFKRYQKE